MITGTAYFISVSAARRYYAEQGYDAAAVNEKFTAGEIFLGKPPLRPGQKLVAMDDGARWGIEEEEDGKTNA